MDSFVLTLAEARVMYRRYHSLLEKGRKRLPGGEFWKELGTAFHGSGSPCTTGFRQNAGNPSEGRGCGRRLRMGWFF